MDAVDPVAERAAILASLRTGAESVQALMPRMVGVLSRSPQSIKELAADEVLGELLANALIRPIWLERRMTELRRVMLMRRNGETLWPLASRLAIQCHLNEYAWMAEPDELARVAELEQRAPGLAADELLLLACYRPLADLDIPLDRDWPEPVRAVLDEQVLAVREARALAAGVPAITPIRAGVSQAVRSQYEENPYPRWRRAEQPPTMPSILGWPIPPTPQVLIAGCGTGRHAIETSQRYAGARVLAVDLSRASLGYAMRKTREAGVDYIDYAQADLLELAASERRFDIIESVGVLHHLADPFEGARALVGLLKPGGVLKLGLYSATARLGLKAAKALAATYGPARVRELRRAIITAPADDPVAAAARFGDFYAVSSCRDLLMHVQEHEMGVDDLQRIVSENGLRFLGFAHTPQVKAAYRAMNPEDPRGLDLDRWRTFEAANPRTFSGMYQFWVHKPA